MDGLFSERTQPILQGWERIATPEEKRAIELLGAYGLYDASFDEYPTIEHPEDNQWIVRSGN